MYVDFYQLRERPFNVTSDPKFLYLNACYREALASLQYGITQRKGFVTLIGEAGTGKTTLLKKLLDELDASTRTVFIFNTNVSFDEMLEYIFHEFDLPVHNGKRLYMLQRLNTFLLEELRLGRNVALLIDEAQDLEFSVLEDLRLLSNLETAKEKILQIVLSGQPELGQKLANPGLRQLRQRIAINCRLQPLSRDETTEYIQSRLGAAGAPDTKLFARDAEDHIFEISKGIPRVVNIVCDNALVIGYALGKKRIGADVIAEAAADLVSAEPPAPPAPREAAEVQSGPGAAPAVAPAPSAAAAPAPAAERAWRGSQLGMIAIVVLAIVVGLLSAGRTLLRRDPDGARHVARRPPLEVVNPGERIAAGAEARAAAPGQAAARPGSAGDAAPEVGLDSMPARVKEAPPGPQSLRVRGADPQGEVEDKRAAAAEAAEERNQARLAAGNAKLAEAARLAEKAKAEAARLEEEKAAKAAEKARLAEAARLEREAKAAEKAKLAEAARLEREAKAEQARQAELKRMEAEQARRAERERLAELARVEREAKAAEAARRAEAARLEQEARAAAAAREAEERRAAESARLAENAARLAASTMASGEPELRPVAFEVRAADAVRPGGAAAPEPQPEAAAPAKAAGREVVPPAAVEAETDLVPADEEPGADAAGGAPDAASAPQAVAALAPVDRAAAPSAAQGEKSPDDGHLELAVPHDQYVTARPGDSVSGIASRKYGAASYTILDLMKIANPSIENIDRISAGQQVRLPQLDQGLALLHEKDGKYALLLMSTPQQRRANEVEAALRQRGFHAQVRRTDFGSGRIVFRLLVPDLADREQAVSVGSQLQKLFREDQRLAAMTR